MIAGEVFSRGVLAAKLNMCGQQKNFGYPRTDYVIEYSVNLGSTSTQIRMPFIALDKTKIYCPFPVTINSIFAEFILDCRGKFYIVIRITEFLRVPRGLFCSIHLKTHF